MKFASMLGMETALTTMSNKELDRLGLMVRVHKKRTTQAEAATSLSLSLRQIERLYRRYREEGPGGLASRKRGKVSNRKLSESYRGG